MKVLAKDIKNKETVKLILDSIKLAKNYNKNLDEGSFQYRKMCKKAEEVLFKIDEAIVGIDISSYKSWFNTFVRLFTYLDYVEGRISSWDKFVSEIKYYNDELLIDL